MRRSTLSRRDSERPLQAEDRKHAELLGYFEHVAPPVPGVASEVPPVGDVLDPCKNGHRTGAATERAVHAEVQSEVIRQSFRIHTRQIVDGAPLRCRYG